jgi:hypothetical protein
MIKAAETSDSVKSKEASKVEIVRVVSPADANLIEKK